MKEKLTNCFYCQGLNKQLLTSSGKCAFCGVYNNPLYLIIYQNQPKLFCCSCAWWQFPRSEQEKETENRYFNRYFSERAK